MPIASTDIKFYLTGGATNTDANASLGGAISSTEITSGQLNNLFDDVTGDEASAGDTEYRCVGIKNTENTHTLERAVAWISTETAAGDSIDIASETPATDAVQTVADESTAPTGVTFSHPTAKTGGITLTGEGDASGDLSPDAWVGVWLKRVVPSSATAYTDNFVEVKVEGDTP